MKNPEIRKLWDDFTEKYSKYFLSNEDQWKNVLTEVSKYIDENKKRPSSEDKDVNIKKLGNWLIHQQRNYKNKQQIMKDPDIRLLWEQFTEKYSNFFK